MELNEWLRYGIEQGWCGPPVCVMHDGFPMSDAECEDEADPCVHGIRLYEDAEQKAAVERDHSPSVWRNVL